MTDTPSTRRAIGWSGLASIVLIFGGQGFAQVGGGEPAFDAPAADILAFFHSRDPTLYPIGGYLQLLGMLALLCFVGASYVSLRAREGEQPWRATVALVCGTAAVAPLLSGGWDLAYLRRDGLDEGLARLAFDMGNLGFANAWVPLGGFAAAAGAVLLTRPERRWLGWWAVAAGVSLVAVRPVWTSSAWFFGYALFWLWVATFSVLALRGDRSRVAEPAGPRRER
jgi:hypothetical protein